MTDERNDVTMPAPAGGPGNLVEPEGVNAGSGDVIEESEGGAVSAADEPAASPGPRSGDAAPRP
ncbi:MAG: hypothetical protein M3Q27_04305 [Actinomycetota bacterium]|nr:hypothetical protein [Actinomycetota bacterium]